MKEGTVFKVWFYGLCPGLATYQTILPWPIHLIVWFGSVSGVIFYLAQLATEKSDPAFARTSAQSRFSPYIYANRAYNLLAMATVLMLNLYSFVSKNALGMKFHIIAILVVSISTAIAAGIIQYRDLYGLSTEESSMYDEFLDVSIHDEDDHFGD